MHFDPEIFLHENAVSLWSMITLPAPNLMIRPTTTARHIARPPTMQIFLRCAQEPGTHVEPTGIKSHLQSLAKAAIKICFFGRNQTYEQFRNYPHDT